MLLPINPIAPIAVAFDMLLPINPIAPIAVAFDIPASHQRTETGLKYEVV